MKMQNCQMVTDEVLVIAAQQLHAQSDALVPLPGDDSDVPGVERRLEQILLVGVVVDVTWEKLQRDECTVKHVLCYENKLMMRRKEGKNNFRQVRTIS